MDYRQTIEDSQGGLERLISKVPGYRGYKEKENRRAADTLLREHLAGQLDEQRHRLVELQRSLLDSGGLMLMDDLDRAVTKVQKLADKIRTASYGYAGLFDAVKVKEEDLDALYEFDGDMLTHILNIQTAVDSLAGALGSGGEDVKGAIRGVTTAADEAESAWRKREQAILGPAAMV